jgi:hypothetical protein
MRRRVRGIDRLQTQFQRSSAEYTKFIVKRFLLLARRNQHDNLREKMSRLGLECCRPVTLGGVVIFRLPSDVCPFITQFSNSTSRPTAVSFATRLRQSETLGRIRPRAQSGRTCDHHRRQASGRDRGRCAEWEICNEWQRNRHHHHRLDLEALGLEEELGNYRYHYHQEAIIGSEKDHSLVVDGSGGRRASTTAFTERERLRIEKETSLAKPQRRCLRRKKVEEDADDENDGDTCDDREREVHAGVKPAFVAARSGRNSNMSVCM